ncbi:MAG: hypothetical protein LAO78_14275 [Acidobacteriia bacterium]|nr:hypothetical protein [Terriglobia bacterium]
MSSRFAENAIENETIPVGTMRKVVSVILLFLGIVLIYETLLLAIAMVLASPGYFQIGSYVYDASEGWNWGSILLFSVIGIGLLLSGAKLWGRWRLPAGILLVIMSLWTITQALHYRVLSQQPGGSEFNRTWAARTAAAYAVVIAVTLLAGIALVVAGRRRHPSPASLPAPSTGASAIGPETTSAIKTKKAS